MPGRSLSEIDADLAAARAARTRILTGGQAKGSDGATKTEAGLGEIRETIAELERERRLAAGSGGGAMIPTIGTGY